MKRQNINIIGQWVETDNNCFHLVALGKWWAEVKNVSDYPEKWYGRMYIGEAYERDFVPTPTTNKEEMMAWCEFQLLGPTPPPSSQRQLLRRSPSIANSESSQASSEHGKGKD